MQSPHIRAVKTVLLITSSFDPWQMIKRYLFGFPNSLCSVKTTLPKGSNGSFAVTSLNSEPMGMKNQTNEKMM